MLPETEHGEPHRSGHRFADLAVALCALFVSFCSLGLAVHHGHTMQRLVEANSRPLLQFSYSNGASAGDARAFTVSVSNPGAGAARIERFAIAVDGRAVMDWRGALTALAGTPQARLGDLTYAAVAPSYLKAGAERVVMHWPRSADNSSLWDQVVASGETRVRLEACFCSIFEECWVQRSDVFAPRAVHGCG